MPTCPSCTKELPGEFPFCPFCGAPLTAQPTAAVQEERKVVTVLFCDLVGFTAASEAADPEDVRSRIRPYHARLRQEIERYSGTVEKFIGDAVMAVFGAPVAHEDDAERAVRAGLRILEAIADLNEQDPALSLQVRIGINTGEAVVALGARPEEGEGMVTGDVVNTASRLQGAAPVNGIAVSEQTYRVTERVFDYGELEPVEVKGKTEPLAVFRPLVARARFGLDVTRTHATPLVGRELEQQLLIGTFKRAATQRSSQLVTIVGEPGVGKSRLCAELLRYLDEREPVVRWRQGRCLPYGDGIAFWALGEIVKAECGILESDSPQQAAVKLEQALSRDDPDLPWLRARLAPLVGAGGEPAAQEESFTAWRRCLESWAEARETVLVFEDLHWADPALLSFLEHVAEWSEQVPLLLLCTARPELYEQYPTFGANAKNAQRINLAPLTDDETARLISSLLERVDLPAEAQRVVLERAGGNPLYAEEFVRLVVDRRQRRSVTEDMPDSVQALIAARLDTLGAARKSLLQDAAVVGNVFWAGALVEMGTRSPGEVELALHELARRELVHRSRTTAMNGEAEYSFWHVLVRDVCYAQIPRASRAARHLAAAAWIERKAGARVEDLADVLAHHYLRALELSRAAGRAETAELTAGAIRYLALAGERALALDVASAEVSLAKALELAPADDPERARLLQRWAQAAHPQGRLQDAKAALEDAITLYRERDELLAAGRALTELVAILWALGDPARRHAIDESLAVLEAEPPGLELVAAYGELAGVRYEDGALPEAVEAADNAVQLASRLGLAKPARGLGFGAAARCLLGEREGLEDMRRALSLSLERGKGREAAVHYWYLAEAANHYEGPQAALDTCGEGIGFCERRGIQEVALRIAILSLVHKADLGLSDEALKVAASLAAQADKSSNVPGHIVAQSLHLRLLAHRGEGAHASPAAHQLARRSRNTGVPWELAFGLGAASQLLFANGESGQAESVLCELTDVPGVCGTASYAHLLPQLVRSALPSSPALARRLTEGFDPRTPLQQHAYLSTRAQLAEAVEQAGAADLYAEAAAAWREFGNAPEHAYALLGRGRCLAALGRADAEEPLREARELFDSMGYKPALAEAGALLGEGEAAAV